MTDLKEENKGSKLTDAAGPVCSYSLSESDTYITHNAIGLRFGCVMLAFSLDEWAREVC